MSTDYTKGIFQSIGLKEFHDFLILDEVQRNCETGQKLFKTSLENLKAANKRYAKYQNKTIKNRFLGHPGRQVPPIYKLDTTDVIQWEKNVYEKATNIINHYQNGTVSSHQSEPFLTNPSYVDGNSPRNSHFCETCQRLIIGDMEYKIHQKSNKHKKALRKLHKRKSSAEKSNIESSNTNEGSNL